MRTGHLAGIPNREVRGRKEFENRAGTKPGWALAATALWLSADIVELGSWTAQDGPRTTKEMFKRREAVGRRTLWTRQMRVKM